MKKWFFLLVGLLLLSIPLIEQLTDIRNEEDRLSQFEMNPIHNGSVEVKKEQIYQGNLLLVNPEIAVHKNGMATDVINLFENKDLTDGFQLLDSTIQLSRSLLDRFTVMIRGAERDGINHFMINSGFRDLDEQQQLYDEKGSDYALPAGYSEHNLGLSLDIGSTQGEMSRAPEGKWLKKHAWKYGFILRYPEDKTHITGIQYEPWHFRYVGLPHSKIMHDEGWTLEEYLQELREQENISKTVEGTTYEITYYPITKNRTIPIPEHYHYEISGNNTDGVIITVSP